ncbi:E3 ubiquitin-protein ligase TM129-like [Styela clava]
MDHSSPTIIFSIFYWLFAFCFIVGPADFKGAGLTVENLLSSWLGSEEIDFVNFHIKRTSATLIVHCLFPIGYYVGMTLVPDSGVSFGDMFSTSLELGWHVYSSISLVILLGALTVVFYWQINSWSYHPIATNLSLYKSEDNTSDSAWRVQASEVNNEFRRIDKYATSFVGWTRVIVTENWIIVTSLYGVKLTPQDKATISVLQTEEHAVSPESNAMVQYVHLRIKPTIQRTLKPYFARVISVEFKDLKESLRTRVYTLPDLSILQSTDELFLKAFREQLNQNDRYTSSDPLDQCIGCMQRDAEVKLTKNCGSTGPHECKSCNCKPMWCAECMGRWYASRQDRHRIETWLSGSATCPMCRAKFCMLDISLLDT